MCLRAFRHFRFGVSVQLLLGLGVAPGAVVRAQSSGATQTLAEAIEIDANAASHPFPHFWEKMFGSRRPSGRSNRPRP